MTTFSTRILQCPSCNNKMYTYQLNSYTVFSSTVYSDGETVSSPMVMQDKNILICTECSKPFWTEDAILPVENNDLNIEELPQAMDVHDLPFAFDSNFSRELAEYYSDLLDNAFANTIEREVFLRIELWRVLNNGTRNKTEKNLKEKITTYVKEVISKNDDASVTDEPNDLFNSNLKKLISIFKPNNNDELLLLAEMYRENGNFSEALKVMNKINNIDNNSAYKEILKAIKTKNKEVFKLNQK